MNYGREDNMENIFYYIGLYLIIGYIQFNWVVLTSVPWSRGGQEIDLLKSLKAIGVGTLLWPIVTLLYGWASCHTYMKLDGLS